MPVWPLPRRLPLEKAVGLSELHLPRQGGHEDACPPRLHGTSEDSRSGDRVAATAAFSVLCHTFSPRGFKSFFLSPFALLKK